MIRNISFYIKSILILAFLTLSSNIFATEQNNIAKKMLMQFCDFYNKRDIESLSKLVTTDVILWGTGQDEYIVGREEFIAQIKRDWSQSEKSVIKVYITVNHNTNEVLWVAARANFNVTLKGIAHSFPEFRGTFILALEDGEWKIAHIHASFPDIRQPGGESFPNLTPAIAKK